MKNLLFILLVLSISGKILCQSNAELALEKKNKAIELMDNGSPDEAILLLEEAKILDPGTYIYDYEIGFAYSIKKDYPKAINIFKKVIKYKDANDQCFQMLGNMYDYNGDPSNALKSYDKGLKKFPDSGRLYLEKGTVYWIQEKYNEALNFYEQGIKVDPDFPSNYYRAAILFCNSNEEVWGMIYGEIFMNLEPNTKRTEEISKLLYDTYKSQIIFSSDTSFSVSFSKNATINIHDIKIPYGVGVYEPTLMISLLDERKIDLISLSRIREKFITNYFEKNFNIKYPNILFNFHKRLLDIGLFHAYNYWLLSNGEPGSFNSWKSDNKELWENFVDWYDNNRLLLTKDSAFNRDQY